MFPNGPAPVRYSDPWAQSLASRLAALSRGAPRVAYFYERPDTSTFRYRCFNMIEALEVAEPGIGAAWFSAEDLEWSEPDHRAGRHDRHLPRPLHPGLRPADHHREVARPAGAVRCR